MTHTYSVTGMSCGGCQATVQKLLSAVPGIKNVSVDLKNAEATIDMENHISTTQLQSALKSHPKYQLDEKKNSHNGHAHSHTPVKSAVVNNIPDQNEGEYYCPMHCEGDKTYDKPGNCPVCGMNLEKIPSASVKRNNTPARCILKLSGMRLVHVLSAGWIWCQWSRQRMMKIKLTGNF